jgi:poly(A) polymerase
MGQSTPSRTSKASKTTSPSGNSPREEKAVDAEPNSTESKSRSSEGDDVPAEAPRQYEVGFDTALVDPDVSKVVRRLVRHGHEAYLVGGCVRDLLLSREPKDFDVATSAHPEDVRALFRNSRIIGRRFRLVHVMFHGRKVIEVATFRRSPHPASDGQLIRNDNAFGDAHEDAMRRDFTINALFYDVENKLILDWAGGMRDIRRRLVRTIGPPEGRFAEDPIRILRAIKFSGRLDLGISPDAYDAIVYCRETLQQSARPRVAEEILRLMRGGGARRSIYIAWETGVLDVLLPELAALLYDADGDDTPGARVWRQLSYIDSRHRAGDPLDDTVLWTLLLLEAMKESCEGQRDRARAVSDFLDHLIERLAITRRSADGMRRIVAALPRIQNGKPGRMMRSETFPLVLDVAEADRLSEGKTSGPIAKMREAYLEQRPEPRRQRRF